MKLSVNKALSAAPVLMMAVAFAFMARVYAAGEGDGGAVPPGLSGTGSGMWLPLGYWDNGKIKTKLMAEKATIPEKGPVVAVNVTCEFYTVSGAIDMVMTANDCTYDREAKTATSLHNVRLAKKDVVLTGTGLDWDSNGQVVTIKSNVVVVVQKAMMNMNVLKGKRK